MPNDLVPAADSSDDKEILVLCHRIPYPPNKGDKIRSFHMVRHLARQGWRIHLGALADDPNDLDYLDSLRPMCASLAVEPLTRWHKLRSGLGALKGTSFSVEYFHDGRLQRFVDDILARRTVSAALVVCAPMAEYLLSRAHQLPPRVVLDLMDVDSEKWREYARRCAWPMSWVYSLEARLLGEYERLAGQIFDHVILVSEAEASLYRQVHGNSEKVTSVSNGVDLEYFSTNGTCPPQKQPKLVFCGAMDYYPNIDAVTWFASDVLPLIRSKFPETQFWIVGANPAAGVLTLADKPGVHVTGSVDDVREFVAGASLSVAPMRIARGVQNKVLEAMAMGKAVLVTPQALEGIDANPGWDVAVAPCEPEAFAGAAVDLLREISSSAIMGARARTQVERHYSWDARLASLDELLR